MIRWYVLSTICVISFNIIEDNFGNLSAKVTTFSLVQIIDGAFIIHSILFWPNDWLSLCVFSSFKYVNHPEKNKLLKFIKSGQILNHRLIWDYFFRLSGRHIFTRVNICYFDTLFICLFKFSKKICMKFSLWVMNKCIKNCQMNI